MPFENIVRKRAFQINMNLEFDILQSREQHESCKEEGMERNALIGTIALEVEKVKIHTFKCQSLLRTIIKYVLLCGIGASVPWYGE